MTQVPANNTDYAQLLREWEEVKAQAAKLKDKEMALRKLLFGVYFPNPVEGTNSFLLGEGATLKGVYKFSREVDPGELSAYGQKLVDQGISLQALIKWTPGLELKKYRELTAEQRAEFDRVLIIKPGSPSMEIVYK